ncbi:hypothetical protein FRC09_015870 [Ceratobasidium sp. 395]|nr:hypothetical protein FRC09_015870 [Ceratobasidium sp. 395]
MVLASDREIDGYWANFIKTVVSFAETLAYCKLSKLFAGRFTNEYYTWLNTLTFVRQQVLNNPGGDESLRANARGAESAWMSVGKVFEFTTHTRADDGSQEPIRANGCTNLRCPGVTESMAVCGRCTKARYCSRVCQDT